MTTPTLCRVLVRRLGKVDYSAALALQQSLASQYKGQLPQDQVVGEVLLCEHSPVYTFGLREADYQTRAAKLKRLGADVVKVRRGGLTTFHGPGQLVCYPVLNLRSLKIGVKDYVKSLERAVISSLRQFGVEGFTTEHTGVWTAHLEKGESKICSIGIQVSHGVCYHGLAINCNTALHWYQHITPCGVEGKDVTSLSEMCGRTVNTGQVEHILTQNLASSVGFKIS